MSDEFELADLSDPSNVNIRQALNLYCRICGAIPRQPCRNTKNPPQALPGRQIHLARVNGPTTPPGDGT